MWIARVLIGMVTSVSLAVGGCGGSASGPSTDGAAKLDAPASSGGSLAGRGGAATGGAGGTGGAQTGGSGGNAMGGAGGSGAPDAPAAWDTPGRTGGAGGSASGPGGVGGSSSGVVTSTGGNPGTGGTSDVCAGKGPNCHRFCITPTSCDCPCEGGTGGATSSGGAAGNTAAGGASGNGGQTDGSAGQTCTYNGATYPYGATWPSTDGCHECWCDGSPNAVCDVGPACDGGVVGSYPSCPYAAGATFPSTDGCNTCECLWIWTPGLACTMKDCSRSPVVDASPPVDATAAACVYNGKTYPLDTHFQATDGCNYCHCIADNQVTCTFRQDCLRDAGVHG